MKIKLAIIFSIFTYSVLFSQETVYSPQNQLDLNNAGLEEIRRLPVPDQVAEKLYERVLYKGFFTSIYQLREIEDIDQQLLNTLKPLIRIEPYAEKSDIEERIEEMYYQLDQWSGNEGINDALIDLWFEKALTPLDVNTASYDDLINLQNVSPVDAASIIRYRQLEGEIQNSRELRSINGLSYYGYRNASRFLDYRPAEQAGVHGHFTARLDNTPFFSDEETANTEAGLNTGYDFGVNGLPNMYYKMRFTYGEHVKFGYSYTRNLNEPDAYFNSGALQIPKGKYYLGYEGFALDEFKVNKAYLGYYSLSIGQGVVMENTDFFTPRKNGLGFRKRFTGISGDNSRSRQFALRGVAADVQYGPVSGLFFGSYLPRDAILNTRDNGESFNQLIILDQRFEYSPDDADRGPDNLALSWREAVNELTYGTHLQYNFQPGTYIGFTYYESAYDKEINPYIEEVVESSNMGRLVLADTEIRNAYGFDISKGTNPFWGDAVSFRRVYGLDFQAIINNVAIQGEFGELDKGGKFYQLGDDPTALVLSAYAQYNNLNIYALYRNYDLGYDNPYQRSFSNYRRFKGTIFEDYYYLQSALYGQLYENAAQPQAEEGYYINTYYQISRNINSRVEYDNWVRKADGAPQYRLVASVNYRPVFPLNIQLRQKWQARNEQNNITLNYFKNLEFRGRMSLRLSGYDNLELIYANGKTIVHPRPRVFGDMVLDGEAIGGGFTHNFNQFLKFKGMLAYYKGFFWNFEDTQFVVLDSQRGAIRSWWSVYARLNNNFSLRFKLTFDHHKPVNNVAFTNVSSPESGSLYETDYLKSSSNYYYLEFNYNF